MTSNQIALRDFQSFLARRLEAEFESDLSPEDAVALWREEQETLEAVRDGLTDVAEGRTQPLDEFDAEFRKRHGLAPRA